MKEIVHFEPLHEATYQEYIAIGTRAYNQHYAHLWPNGDTTPYITTSFSLKVLQKEALDKNTQLYIIRRNRQPIGILKFTTDAGLGTYTKEDALYIDKIYLQKEDTGTGIGKKILQFVILRAQAMNKKIVWLDTMQKGPALNFYLKNNFQIFGPTEIQLPHVLKSEKRMHIMIHHLTH